MSETKRKTRENINVPIPVFVAMRDALRATARQLNGVGQEPEDTKRMVFDALDILERWQDLKVR